MTRGNTVKRPAPGGGEQDLVWDELNQLTEVTKAGGSVARMVYDADGARILRQQGTTTTLYVAGNEISLNTATSVVSANRYYGHAGHTVAVRTGASNDAVTTLVSDWVVGTGTHPGETGCVPGTTHEVTLPRPSGGWGAARVPVRVLVMRGALPTPQPTVLSQAPGLRLSLDQIKITGQLPEGRIFDRSASGPRRLRPLGCTPHAGALGLRIPQEYRPGLPLPSVSPGTAL